MIKDAEYLERIKRAWLAKQEFTLGQRFDMLDALYEEARSLGRFQEEDLLTGLDDLVRWVALLHANVSRPPLLPVSK
jgi:hypothetical protein